MKPPKNLYVEGWFSGNLLARSLRRTATLSAFLACAALVSAYGQARGVAPTVTSIGNGAVSAPRPSITSMGPFGWQAPPAFWLPQPLPCTVFSTTAQTGSICASPLAPGLGGAAPLLPFDPSGFGPAGQNAGFVASPRSGGVGAIAVGVPFPVPYLGAMPNSVLIATDPDGSIPDEAGREGRTNAASSAPIAGAVPATSAAAAGALPGAAPIPTLVPDQRTTVLVLRDGRRLEVRNYAIVAGQVVNMSGSPRKISIDELDLNATVQANEDRGVIFALPPSRKDAKSSK